eukprot:1158946-Pelagomonas_calceolata.AAC.3
MMNIFPDKRAQFDSYRQQQREQQAAAEAAEAAEAAATNGASVCRVCMHFQSPRLISAQAIPVSCDRIAML